jgi:hypothetical protein
MKLIIHAGMNKTGSSSIQQSLASHNSPELNFIDWRSQNHSDMFVLLFHDEATRSRYHVFRTQGMSKQDLDKDRQHWLDNLRRQLDANSAEVTVFSGEDISQPTSMSGCQNMFDFFSDYFDEISVIAYVRPPRSFMNSTFQQRVKSSGLSEIRAQSLWPKYQARFEKLDLVFGKENVELVPFVKDCMLDGDVVRDFWSRIGLECPNMSIPRVNDSLSLEALALLFYQRKLGGGLRTGRRDARILNNSLIQALEGVGSEKFSFSDDFLNSTFRKNAKDLAWMEERLGQKLGDQLSSSSTPISTESDLIGIALEQVEALSEATVREALKVAAEHPDLVVQHLLECLRNICETQATSGSQ